MREFGPVASAAPQEDQLGYEAALDLGVVALEQGFTAAAVPYLERAASCRATRFALVQLAKAHRDLGQLDAARKRLEQARSLPDGNDHFVLITLAAVLCDLQEHGSAFEVAMDAAQLNPKAPATLSILARCTREIATTLAKQPHIDPAAIDAALAQADQFAREAREAQPEAVSNLKERRRARATQAWSISAPATQISTPVEQGIAAILDHSCEQPKQLESISPPIAEIDEPGRLTLRARIWRLLLPWRGS